VDNPNHNHNHNHNPAPPNAPQPQCRVFDDNPQQQQTTTKPHIPNITTKCIDKTQNEEEEKEKEFEPEPNNLSLPNNYKKTTPHQPEFPTHDERESVNFVLIGHVDAGKSTIAGQILFSLHPPPTPHTTHHTHCIYLYPMYTHSISSGEIDTRTIAKYKKLAISNKRGTWVYAYILDRDTEEQAKGKTVECGKAHFGTKNKRYTLLDAPGHANYVSNMICGVTQADVALLVISAKIVK